MSGGDVGLVLLLAIAAHALHPSQAVVAIGQENVGCLFSPAVCVEEVEWCFDDYAFGKCVRHGAEPESLERYELRRESLHMLQREMERLFSLGYRWTHLYTQCVLQLKLQVINDGEEYDKEICAPLADQDLNSALKAFEGEEQDLSPDRTAHVKYTPSAADPQSDFADEVYVPLDQLPPDNIEGFPENVIKGEGDEYRNEETPLRKILLQRGYGPTKRQHWPRPAVAEPLNAGVYPIESYLDNERKPVEESRHFSKQYNTPEGFRMGIEAKDLTEALQAESNSFNRAYNTPKTFRLGIETKDLAENDETQNDDDVESLIEDVYAAPVERQFAYDTYRSEVPGNRLNPSAYNRDPATYMFEAPEYERVSGYGREDPGYGRDNFQPRRLGGGAPFRIEDRLSHDLEVLAEEISEKTPGGGRVYTEGGLVALPGETSDDDELLDGVSDELVRDYTMGASPGFKRLERLDVKKPGPNFNLNNFAFNTQKLTTNTPVPKAAHPSAKKLQVQQAPSHQDPPPQPLLRVVNPKGSIVQTLQIKPDEFVTVDKKGVGSPKGSPNLRKAASEEDDDSSAFIKFSNPVGDWKKGVNILRATAVYLDIDPNAFTRTRIEDNEILFKIDRSIADISASEVAKRIDAIKDTLKRDLHVEVIATGIIKNSQPVAMRVTASEERQLWLVSFLLCGVIAAAAIAGAAFFFVRRHTHTKDKLTSLKQPDSEASKDYQELCRARMASKTAQDKPEGVAGRMGSSSGEPKSPSSRSSTSSWSEEPALSNMDISTGHMVLSYMEDHLKNKDRLEQEWVALCAYEAEPCAVTIATAEDNLKKNRYPDMVPYDHSRVLLNQLLNINGSDYINASTITDHDPRNPAYIATQGPLEGTTADLWQMLWEQGSVVMVMLTRLSENGTSMCYRYWPEEGSHIYHIYEVHLVSEHIWCDDYLVRSFYLKNLKTGETRTVTQFHFLSWPENGVPLSTKALLEFRRKVNKSYRGRSCPIVVHCSDGVGRAGTYCLIDMVLNRMAKGAKEIDIAATLEHIRDQRPSMVKTKQQFEFVLMAVAEEVHAILKALPATHSPPPVSGGVTKEKE